MPIIIPVLIDAFSSDTEVLTAYRRIEQLLHDVQSRKLKTSSIDAINMMIIPLMEAESSISTREYLKLLNNAEKELLLFLSNEYGWLVKKYYTTKWLLIGVLAIGIPVGVLLVLLSNRKSFLILGLFLGSLLGQWIGNKKDERLKLSGKQLNISRKIPRFL